MDELMEYLRMLLPEEDRDQAQGEQSDEDFILHRLHEHCIYNRSRCRIEHDFKADGKAMKMIHHLAASESIVQDFVRSEAFLHWNERLDKVWHDEVPRCSCGPSPWSVCEICYQIQAGFRRPWYLPYPSSVQEQDLCESCAHVDWGYLLGLHGNRVQNSIDGPHDAPLGTLNSMRARGYCNLCRFCLETWESCVPDQYRELGVTVQQGSVSEDRNVGSITLKFYIDVIDGRITLPSLDLSAISTTYKPNFTRLVPNDRSNIALIKEWFSEINTASRDRYPVMNNTRHHSISLSKSIWLIDVGTQRLVKATTDFRYLALSYVWGKVEQFRCSKDNVKTLQQPGVLKMIELSQTVRDAIDLVCEIDEKYLWIDTICIIQDDPAHLAAQISLMGDIYSSAISTIVAAVGHDANVGLIGYRLGTRGWTQRRTTIGGILVGTYNFTEAGLDELNTCSWRKRAWTFQEELLASRQLVFTSVGVLFLTQRGQSSEFVYDEHDSLQPKTHSVVAQYDSDRQENIKAFFKKDISHMQLAQHWTITGIITYDCYVSLVNSYAERSMTNSWDILNGCEGILSLLSLDIKYGMPCEYLHIALRWSQSGRITRRRSASGQPVFPSYSWAGWEGKLTMAGYSAPEWHLTATDEQKSIYWAERRNRPHPFDGTDHLLDFTSKDARWTVPSRVEPPVAGGVAVKFFANVASMWLVAGRLIQAQYTADKGVPTVAIFTEKGEVAGSVRVETATLGAIATASYDFLAMNQPNNGNPYTNESSSRLEFGKDEPVDFQSMTIEEKVAARYPSWEIHIPSSDTSEQFDKKYFDAYNYFMGHIEIMLIHWDNGIAYRLGMGQCHIDAFQQAGPKVKKIILC